MMNLGGLLLAKQIYFESINVETKAMHLAVAYLRQDSSFDDFFKQWEKEHTVFLQPIKDSVKERALEIIQNREIK